MLNLHHRIKEKRQNNGDNQLQVGEQVSLETLFGGQISLSVFLSLKLLCEVAKGLGETSPFFN